MRSLQRGLEVLRLLNIRNGLTLTQMAKASGLARGTAYRILNTLIANGFVRRQEPDGQYFLMAKVTVLSNGFDTENWPTEVAKPLMVALGEQISWPVVLATLFGTSMVVRENTDSLTSMVFNVVKPGYSMPVLGSASGWIYLAFCRPEERRALLANIAQEADDPLRLLAISTGDLLELLDRVKTQRYCILPQQAIRSTVVSVPVLDKDNAFLAALSLRYFSSSMSTDAAVETLVEPMTDCANAISKAHQKWVARQ